MRDSDARKELLVESLNQRMLRKYISHLPIALYFQLWCEGKKLVPSPDSISLYDLRHIQSGNWSITSSLRLF